MEKLEKPTKKNVDRKSDEETGKITLDNVTLKKSDANRAKSPRLLRKNEDDKPGALER